MWEKKSPQTYPSELRAPFGFGGWQKWETRSLFSPPKNKTNKKNLWKASIFKKRKNFFKLHSRGFFCCPIVNVLVLIFWNMGNCETPQGFFWGPKKKKVGKKAPGFFLEGKRGQFFAPPQNKKINNFSQRKTLPARFPHLEKKKLKPLFWGGFFFFGVFWKIYFFKKLLVKMGKINFPPPFFFFKGEKM